MKKRIKKNEKSSQHRSQNFLFSPLAEMASENIFRKYKASGYAGVEAIFERDQRNQKFIWGMYDRICGIFCRKTR